MGDKSMRNQLVFVLLVVIPTATWGQFVLPQTPPKEARKPLVRPDLQDYFSINPGSDFIQSFLGGVIPPPNYEVQKTTVKPGVYLPGFSGLPGLNIARSGPSAPQLPISPLLNLTVPQVDQTGNQNVFDSGSQQDTQLRRPTGNSSISGIPDIFPSLPRPPIPQSNSAPNVPQPQVGPTDVSLQNLGSLTNRLTDRSSPGLTNNFGLGSLLSSLSGGQSPNGAGLNSGGLQSLLAASGLKGPPNPLSVQQTPPNPFQSSVGSSPLGSNNGGQIPLPGTPQDENPLALILKSLGLQNLSPQLGDLSNVNSLLGLGGPQNSPVGGNNGVLSSVLYNALTDGTVQTANKNGTDQKAPKIPIIDRGNAAVLQNLLSQPSSPFCSPKPTPVKKFNLESFMGKWFQVLYSPPMSLGPCSMITYSKLSDIGNGGPGTVFNLFEYTTEGTPHGSPRISSGYAIVRDTGEMIYRTSSNPTDLNVYVIETGPVNQQGQYEYVVLGVNCNYPLYVFARDPLDYKQKYEQRVNANLEQKGLATSWSRLLNVVAPVDYNLCNFPPTLFNVQG